MKIALVSMILFAASMLNGQQAGFIIYDDKMDMHKNLPPDREELKDMIPQFSSSKWELIFNGDESLYQPLVAEELTGDQAAQPRMHIRFGRENRILYKNLAADTMIDSRDFMQKLFLISGEATDRKWKIGKSTKSIAGYNCLQASFRADSMTSYEAWFAPRLAISNGPADFHGLPGMILELNMNDGVRVITANQINFGDSKTASIVAPAKGKSISNEEFEKVREEKMKEMHLQHGPGQPNIIIRHN